MDWFEILSENFTDTGGRPAYVLDQMAERYLVVMHGVSMSVGRTDPVNFEYLKKVKQLARRTKARWISDHLCWTGVSGLNTHDLLPMPYTDESLRHVAGRVKIVADYLERPVFLENPSTYLEFSEFSESTWNELSSIVRKRSFLSMRPVGDQQHHLRRRRKSSVQSSGVRVSSRTPRCVPTIPKRVSDSAGAKILTATPCSLFAGAVIADSAIAAVLVGQ